MVNSDNRRRAFEEHGAEIRATFDRLATVRDDGCFFDQPIRINLLRKPG